MPLSETAGFISLITMLVDKCDKVAILVGTMSGAFVMVLNSCCTNTRQLRCSEINCCGCHIKREILRDKDSKQTDNTDDDIVETDDEIIVPDKNINII